MQKIKQYEGNSPIFNTYDCFLILPIIFFSLFTRLWTISNPDKVIFDEVHFGNFTSWYIQKKFHFDIHPPLGKMLMGYIAKLTDYKGDISFADKLGSKYLTDELFYVSQRITPAIFSAMTSPLLFVAMRCLSLPCFFSAAAGIMLTTDISLIVEGKFILSDGILHFFTALHIFALCFFMNKDLLWRAVLAGITLGLASTCKYTALGLLGVDGMTQIVWILSSKPDIKSIVIRAAAFIVPFVTVFLGVWTVHFVLTPYTGYNSNYFSPEYQKTIITPEKENYTYWGNRLLGPGLIKRIFVWNKIMNSINMRSDIPHPYESLPIYWPLLLDKYVLFFSEPNRSINCIGSPATYWMSSICLLLTVIGFVFGKCDWRNALLLWAWSVSYFPFLLVPRTMYMYHYLVPLMFAIMNTCVLIYNVLPRKVAEYIMTVVLILCLLVYFFFSPWIYGYECKDCGGRMWLKQWHEGYTKPVYNYANEFFNTTNTIIDIPL